MLLPAGLKGKQDSLLANLQMWHTGKLKVAVKKTTKSAAALVVKMLPE